MIERREKRRKIFYVPGMISLVLIPLFCICYFFKADAFKKEGCISIYIPADSVTIKKFLSFKRNYQEFDFNSSLDLEKEKLQDLRLVLKKLNRANDTINGVRIHLGNKMQYQVYIRILDIFTIEEMPVYMLIQNDFLVLMLPKPKPKSQTAVREIIQYKCGYWDANKDYFLERKRQRQFEYNLALYKKNWILFCAYMIIVLLNIFDLVKLNKNK